MASKLFSTTRCMRTSVLRMAAPCNRSRRSCWSIRSASPRTSDDTIVTHQAAVSSISPPAAWVTSETRKQPASNPPASSAPRFQPRRANSGPVSRARIAIPASVPDSEARSSSGPLRNDS